MISRRFNLGRTAEIFGVDSQDLLDLYLAGSIVGQVNHKGTWIDVPKERIKEALGRYDRWFFMIELREFRANVPPSFKIWDIHFTQSEIDRVKAETLDQKGRASDDKGATVVETVKVPAKTGFNLPEASEGAIETKPVKSSKSSQPKRRKSRESVADIRDPAIRRNVTNWCKASGRLTQLELKFGGNITKKAIAAEFSDYFAGHKSEFPTLRVYDLKPRMVEKALDKTWNIPENPK